MDGWMDRHKKGDGWRDREIDGWMDNKNRQMVGWTGKKQKDGWMDIKMVGWMDKTNRWMVEWIYICLKKTDGCLHGQENNRRMVGWTRKQQKDGWIDINMDGWRERRRKQMDG